MDEVPFRPLIFKGRGATGNATSRFDSRQRITFDDGWGSQDDDPPPLRTSVTPDAARTAITYNDSPDIPFDRSINPYRGCEHGCIYCYARPSHAYLGLSPGLDFESRLFAKMDATALLRSELARPGYRCAPLALGSNTDAYQPIERELRITRGILEVLAECHHPVSLITKSALVERDIDLLAPMAAQGLAEVYVTITTLDCSLSRKLEPRAAAPERRLETLRRLSAAGIPCGVMTAPVIPALNDSELEHILGAAQAAGARHAGYVLLRLPLELAELFEQWLYTHVPLKAAHVLSLLRQSRGGKIYDTTFGQRMTGQGLYTDLIARRFRLACRRLGLNTTGNPVPTASFRPPAGTLPSQLSLF